MATKRRKVRPVTVGYGFLAVIFVIVVGNLVLNEVRGPDRRPAPALTAAGRPYARALAERLQEPGPIWAGYEGLSAAEARCVAPKWVMILGPERLSTAGIAPADLAEDPGGAVREAKITWDEAQRIRLEYVGCDLAPTTLVARVQGGADGAFPDGVSRERFTCFQQHLDEDATDRRFVLSLTQTQQTDQDLDVRIDIRNLEAACPEGGS